MNLNYYPFYYSMEKYSYDFQKKFLIDFHDQFLCQVNTILTSPSLPIPLQSLTLSFFPYSHSLSPYLPSLFLTFLGTNVSS